MKLHRRYRCNYFGIRAARKEPAFEVETVEDEEYHGPEMKTYNLVLIWAYHYPTIDLMKHYDNAEPTIDMAEQNAVG